MHPSVRASPDQVARLLADEFIEFGSSGRVFDKRQIIELLQQEQGRANQPINLLLQTFQLEGLRPMSSC
jgi:hypothetical protein